jgi:hypothetical protein
VRDNAGRLALRAFATHGEFTENVRFLSSDGGRNRSGTQQPTTGSSPCTAPPPLERPKRSSSFSRRFPSRSARPTIRDISRSTRPSKQRIGALLRLLVERCPEAVRAAARDGNLALHVPAECKSKLEVIRHVVETWRGADRHRNADGFLPIHLAVPRDYVEPDVANLLVEEWPESGRERSNEGWLPRHSAAGEEGRLHVVKRLLKQWPDSIRETTDNGWLPVHIPSEWSPYGSTLTCFLAQEWTQSLEVADKDGWLPLHYAAADGRTLGAMKLLSKGWLKNWVKSSSGLKFLVELNPMSVGVKDDHGNSPLREDWSRENCQIVVDVWPESVQVVGTDGLLPLDRAAAIDAPLELLYFLVAN